MEIAKKKKKKKKSSLLQKCMPDKFWQMGRKEF